MPTILPPTDRDIEIYESVRLAGVSLRSAAERFNLSVTRIRQIVKHIVEWLADHLPPESDIAREKQIQLVKHLAADRLNYAYGELMDLWRETQDTSFLLKTTRLALALARLGVIPGTLDGLFANACPADNESPDRDTPPTEGLTGLSAEPNPRPSQQVASPPDRVLRATTADGLILRRYRPPGSRRNYFSGQRFTTFRRRLTVPQTLIAADLRAPQRTSPSPANVTNPLTPELWQNNSRTKY